MTDRSRALDHFLHQAGWGAAERAVLAGDASFRRYDRLHLNGQPAVLMDAPPPQEDVRPFIRIARQLAHLGYSAPASWPRTWNTVSCCWRIWATAPIPAS